MAVVGAVAAWGMVVVVAASAGRAEAVVVMGMLLVVEVAGAFV